MEDGWPDGVDVMGALCQRSGIWPARGAAGCALVVLDARELPRSKGEQRGNQLEPMGLDWHCFIEEGGNGSHRMGSGEEEWEAVVVAVVGWERICRDRGCMHKWSEGAKV